ncbi:hypothetical protein TNIN_281831 [Trichonephila inaurata madagascariensis]|uniref:Uncharacterized protein n=1 Tax=Trichonephila inaurata madagascariensis TaxID=2747483 RepID=A0A8X7C071_9ARAC|nr:hypothetical protein TNIN_281831 [Trichonephila inaurata madagascariensis]
MALLFDLEILFYLALCAMATLFKGCLPSFIDIFGYVSLIEMIKVGFLLSFERLSSYTERKNQNSSSAVTADTGALKPMHQPKKPFPIVRSVMVHQICQALGLNTELNTSTEFPDFKLPKKMKGKEMIPIVQSETIFKFCDALSLKNALTNSPRVLK